MKCPKCAQMRRNVDMRQLSKDFNTQSWLCMICHFILKESHTSVDRSRIEEGELYILKEEIE